MSKTKIDIDRIKASTFIKGKYFVITGDFKNFSRNDLKMMIEDLGGKLTRDVGIKTDYFVTATQTARNINNNTTNKETALKYFLKIAGRKNKISMLTERQFLNRIKLSKKNI